MPTTTAKVALTPMELTLVRDLPGFTGARRFALEPLGGPERAVFARLRCLDTVTLRDGSPFSSLHLLVTSPGLLWPHYGIELDEALVEELGIESADDVELLAIIHPRRPLAASTANLYSPIVVNRRTGRADQFVPAGSESDVGQSVATPLPLERDD